MDNRRRISRRLRCGTSGAGTAFYVCSVSRHGNESAAQRGWGGLLCLATVFLPAFLLTVGALPYWDALRRRTSIQRALQGINASVVGILLAALYDPVWTSSIRSTGDFALALIAFTLLIFWKQSPLRVVVFTALGGAALALF